MRILHELRVEGTGERAIGRAAGTQRGTVHLEQLRGAGFGRSVVARLLERGTLYVVLPRVFAVGHDTLAPLALELAAVLWSGHDGVISHRSAAAIWGLTPPPPGEQVEMTLIGRGARRHPRVTTYRVQELDARDVRLRHGIPVTAPARTLIDVAGRDGGAAFERAHAEARVLELVSDRELDAALGRCPTRAGAAPVRAALRGERTGSLTRSEAERRLLALIGQAQLKPPETNVRLLGYEVDLLWRAERLVVEVDGHAFHAHRAAFERDRARDQALVAAGYRVIRVTWRQLEREPLAILARIAGALQAAA